MLTLGVEDSVYYYDPPIKKEDFAEFNLAVGGCQAQGKAAQPLEMAYACST